MNYRIYVGQIVDGLTQLKVDIEWKIVFYLERSDSVKSSDWVLNRIVRVDIECPVRFNVINLSKNV